MLRRWLVAAAMLLLTAVADGELEQEPRARRRHRGMSKYQEEYMAGVQAEAKAASDAATPFVLQALEEPAFRAGLEACCPNVASLSARDLLQRYRDEVSVSEMTHNFDLDLGAHSSMGGHAGGKNGNGLGDPPLSVYANSSHFYNLWEVAFLNITSYDVLHGEAGAEQGLFGFRKFGNCSNATGGGGGRYGQPVHCLPATMEQAAERPIYTVLNQRKVDVGCPMFGDLAIVFATTWVQPMTVIAPMDTGWWTSHCNTTKSNGGGNHRPHACSSNTDAQSCNHSWGMHGSCGWNAAADACAPFDHCHNSSTQDACKQASHPPTPGGGGKGKGGRGGGGGDPCVWVPNPPPCDPRTGGCDPQQPPPKCKHFYELACSEKGPEFQRNATLCDQRAAYGHGCKFRNDSSGVGCFSWDCQVNGSVSKSACAAFQK